MDTVENVFNTWYFSVLLAITTMKLQENLQSNVYTKNCMYNVCVYLRHLRLDFDREIQLQWVP